MQAGGRAAGSASRPRHRGRIGERDREGGALPLAPALRPNRTPVQLDQLAHEGEAPAEPCLAVTERFVLSIALSAIATRSREIP
jgi:hypothetical protein